MTTADYLEQLQQDREDLIDNLEAKGITGLSGDETFTELVPEVLNIPSGGDTGAYQVDTIEEMNAITTMKEGDYCIVNVKILPSAYTQLDYIEGTGTQYIDTNVIPNNNTGFEFDGYTINESKIMGANDSNAPLNFNFMNIGDTKYRFQRYGNNSSNGYISIDNTLYPRGVRHIWKMLKNKIYIDNNLITTFTDHTLPTTNKTIYLFALNGASSDIASGSKRCYNCKIYNGDALVRNMIPAKRNSDDVLGMYDTVNNIFYTNAGSGTFNRGNDFNTYEVYKYNGTSWVQA